MHFGNKIASSLSKIKFTAQNELLFALSLLLAANTFLFIERKSTNFFTIFANPAWHYLIYFILLILAIGILLFFQKHNKDSLWNMLEKLYFTLLPTEIVFIVSLHITHNSTTVDGIFYFLTGIYIAIPIILAIKKRFPKITAKPSKNIAVEIKNWFRSQGATYIFSVVAITIIAAGFGSHQIGNFAAVDEALWTFNRIPSFWKNVGEQDWAHTTVSDKPGVPVAIVSGIGLLKVNPLYYESVGKQKPELDVTEMNTAMRLPLLLFAILMIPLFYVFLENLLGKRIALASTAFIGLSPILIGMARIINPDAIFWTFAPLSLIAYLAYLKRRKPWLLYSAGILLGLSILTKYVANILYIYFFSLIILEYIFQKDTPKERREINIFLKNSLYNFFSVTAVSLVTFFVLYPAVWMKPEKLLKGTLLSQAFESVAPIFCILLAFFFIDTFFLQSRILAPIMLFFNKKRKLLIRTVILLFLGFSFFTAIDVYLGMKPFDFETILASPKSSYLSSTFAALFIGNFYPLIFGTAPLAILAIAYGLLSSLRKNSLEKNETRYLAYFPFFIMVYYLGTTVSNVASPIRYQIMLYPLFLIMAGVGLAKFSNIFKKSSFIFSLSIVVTFLVGIATLASIRPFYMYYTSSLLPKEYIINVKDMGEGSFEAAQYLNSLPDAENISIWTDKRGVCNFFVGKCYDGFSYNQLKDANIQYVVISSGRTSRTTNIAANRIKLNSEEKLQLPKYYKKTSGAAFELIIDDRPSQYVKVFEAK